jgi:thiol-disulfide isomerase/thioredoxin
MTGEAKYQHRHHRSKRAWRSGGVSAPLGKSTFAKETRSMSEQFNLSRRSFLWAAAMTTAAAQFDQIAFARSGGLKSPLSSLAGSNIWLNSQPLTAVELQRKVVLVDFWTYTCINWRRQLPYMRAWAEKYKAKGLVVIGVHAPEFSFEKNVDNVRWATKDMRIDYPVVIDNDRAIWRAFNNEYWPALYFIDAQGRERHHVFGEGEYEQSEVVIQRLLAEAGAGDIGNELVSVDARGAEAAADWSALGSGENYVGSERTENFASPGGETLDKRHEYALPSKLKLNH